MAKAEHPIEWKVMAFLVVWGVLFFAVCIYMFLNQPNEASKSYEKELHAWRYNASRLMVIASFAPMIAAGLRQWARKRDRRDSLQGKRNLAK